MVPCAYNPEHLVRPSRLPYHYTKCETKPEVEHLFSVCPFNVMHRMLTEELEEHMAECPDNQPSLDLGSSEAWNDVD